MTASVFVLTSLAYPAPSRWQWGSVHQLVPWSNFDKDNPLRKEMEEAAQLKLTQPRLAVQQARVNGIVRRISEAARVHVTNYLNPAKGYPKALIDVPYHVKRSRTEIPRSLADAVVFPLEFLETLDDSELAFLIAHEWDHVQRGDFFKDQAAFEGGTTKPSFVDPRVFQKRNWDKEFSADSGATQLVVWAGFGVPNMDLFFEKSRRLSSDRAQVEEAARNGSPTHPSDRERIENIDRTLAQMKKQLEAASPPLEVDLTGVSEDYEQDFVKAVLAQSSFILDSIARVYPDLAGMPPIRAVPKPYTANEGKVIFEIRLTFQNGQTRSLLLIGSPAESRPGAPPANSLWRQYQAVAARDPEGEFAHRLGAETEIVLHGQLLEQRYHVFSLEFHEGATLDEVVRTLEFLIGVPGRPDPMGRSRTLAAVPVEKLEERLGKLVSFGLLADADKTALLNARTQGDSAALAAFEERLRGLLQKLDEAGIETMFRFYRKTGFVQNDPRRNNLVFRVVNGRWTLKPIDYGSMTREDSPKSAILAYDVFEKKVEQNGPFKVVTGSVRPWVWTYLDDKTGFFESILRAYGEKKGMEFLLRALEEYESSPHDFERNSPAAHHLDKFLTDKGAFSLAVVRKSMEGIEIVDPRFREEKVTLKDAQGKTLAAGAEAIRRAVEKDPRKRTVNVRVDGTWIDFHIQGELMRALGIKTEEEMAGLIQAALEKEKLANRTNFGALGKKAVTLALVHSKHLGEDHAANGFIGFNAVLGALGDAGVARDLFSWVLAHELWHEVNPSGREGDRLGMDARVFRLLPRLDLDLLKAGPVWRAGDALIAAIHKLDQDHLENFQLQMDLLKAEGNLPQAGVAFFEESLRKRPEAAKGERGERLADHYLAGAARETDPARTHIALDMVAALFLANFSLATAERQSKLEAFSRSEDFGTADRALRILGVVWEGGREGLADHLFREAESGEEDRTIHAIRALGLLLSDKDEGDLATGPRLHHLASFLRDSHDSVRRAALEAMADVWADYPERATAAEIQAVYEALGDPNLEVRAAAYHAYAEALTGRKDLISKELEARAARDVAQDADDSLGVAAFDVLMMIKRVRQSDAPPAAAPAEMEPTVASLDPQA